jgi:hypothetical protein
MNYSLKVGKNRERKKKKKKGAKRRLYYGCGLIPIIFSFTLGLFSGFLSI